jgi:hypothetical protein
LDVHLTSNQINQSYKFITMLKSIIAPNYLDSVGLPSLQVCNLILSTCYN